MKQLFFTFFGLSMSLISFAQEAVCVHDTVYISQTVVDTIGDAPAEIRVTKNNWGAKLKESNIHLGIDLQTKYVWRGMEMMPENSSPVVFPGINYSWHGLYVYAMGGYALNGKYAEVDFGLSYTWKGLTIAFSDYYYPVVVGKEDEYFGGKHNGHWLEASITYSPKKTPVWITVSNFFAGDDDKYTNANGNIKQAYSTYIESGVYYDFLNNNRISLAVGMTPARSCYTDYRKKLMFCNLDLKYTHNITAKNGWTLPLSVEYIYNPVFDKSYVNFVVNISF